MRRRLRHALDWRLAAVTGRLDRLAAQVRALEAEAGARDAAPTAAEVAAVLAPRLDRLQATLDEDVRPLLRVLAADESANRRRLDEVRAAPGYPRAWTDREPLVTVTIATRDRPDLLTGRALPSVLAQTHERLEVIVVGDAAGADVADAVAAIGDPRVRWENLSQRLVVHPDPDRQWLVGSGMARNEASRLATGAWMLHFDDDDELHPDAVQALLARARETRAEAVYGGFVRHGPDGVSTRHLAFPPAVGEFGWQGALHHAALPFRRELVAADLGVPGDVWLLERMLRAGVRFAMVDRAVWEYYPSTLWGRRD